MHTIDINGIWNLSPRDRHAIAPHCPYFLDNPFIDCTLPGDIHSALLQNGLIADPFVGTNELEIQWVGQHDWVLEKTFTLEKEDLDSGTPFITFTMADTMITLFVNDHRAGEMCNQFRRWRFEICDYLQVGENTIRLVFESAENAAIEANEQLPYPVPYSEYPVHAKHGTSSARPNATAAGIGSVHPGVWNLRTDHARVRRRGFIDSVKFTSVETGPLIRCNGRG